MIYLIFGKDKERGVFYNAKIILYSLIIAVSIRSFLFEPFYIPSGSMNPTLIKGDFIVVSKYSYGYSRYSFPFAPNIIKSRILDKSPKRGDVIVFRLPSNPKINYIKRLIGLPGDLIQMKKGLLYINNKLISKVRNKDVKNSKEYIEKFNDIEFSHSVLDTKKNSDGDNTKIFKVPENHYFFLGDNRDNSMDSRFSAEQKGVSFVNKKYLVGKARIIVLSAKSNPLYFWKWFSAIRGNRFFKKI